MEIKNVLFAEEAGELLQTLTERHHKDPAKILRMTLALGEEEDEGEE